MKSIYLSIIILLTAFTVTEAKKVKFACDMTGITIMPTGMHITGDFQTAAGFPGGDWNSASTPLTQEPGTDIYSIVVDIPAFAKYEYKFVNGDQFYEVEFVPEFSRVMWNFNDNRWIYVDSLANDTTFVGAIIFGGNAPDGMKLVRFYVDMQNTTVNAGGVHLAGSFQGWNPAATQLYSFGVQNDIHEVIAYVPAGTYEYKFYNGITTPEIIPGICSVNSNREVTVVDDMLLDYICYADCIPCLTGIAEFASFSPTLYPNPATDFVTVKLPESTAPVSLIITDLAGRALRKNLNLTGESFTIERNGLGEGCYLVNLIADEKVVGVGRVIFQ